MEFIGHAHLEQSILERISKLFSASINCLDSKAGSLPRSWSKRSEEVLVM